MEMQELTIDICLAYAGKYASQFEWALRPDQIYSNTIIDGRVYLSLIPNNGKPIVKLAMHKDLAVHKGITIIVREFDIYDPNGPNECQICLDYLNHLFK